MTNVIIKTNFGSIKFGLLPELAPETVRNFVTLAKNGIYDGTLFHRVIPGFMIQGGDPNTKDPNKKSQWGMGGPGHSIKAEFSSRSHLEGIVSMARAADPDSAGSQFFIVTSDNNTESLDRQYTVFGKVTEGMDVAHKIENLPRDGNDCPEQEAKMLEVVISE
jgi:peptidyl-prolyl cis-trans isomerase B (cyclophilin B)